MRVTEVTVGAGRTFNHPFEQYSNLRPSVTFKAELQDGDDPIAIAKQLQTQAEQLVEDHKTFILMSLRNLHYLTEAQRRLVSLESQIKQAQSEVETLRKENPQLALPIARVSPGQEGDCPECHQGDMMPPDDKGISTCPSCGYTEAA